MLGEIVFEFPILILFVFHWSTREDARGVAGVASATPKLENLLYKLGSEFFLKKSLFTVCYTILKFLPSSLVCHKQHQNSYFCSFLLIYGRHSKLDVLLCTILNRIVSFKAVAVSETKEPLKRQEGLRIYVCCILVHIPPTYGNLKFNQWLIFFDNSLAWS